METDAALVRRRLLEWFDLRGRDLPWRRTTDPYAIWVSEVMLQQTRVDTVLPFYLAWMRRFPDVRALARAPRDEVLKAWEGLGYYSRARNLHRAAGVVLERHAGSVPSEVATLRSLPGVGEYTAGAVASIAFDRREPAVDGNVRRVLSRLDDVERPGAAALRRRAAELVDPVRPGDFNQALMDLGATVCVPTGPACGSCPLAGPCLARRNGTVASRPAPRARRTPPLRTFAVAVVVDRAGEAVWMRRRPDDGLLGGMWEFPAVRVDGGDAAVAAVEVAAGVAKDGTGRRPEPSGDPCRVDHAFSHFRATYLAYPFTVGAAGPGPRGSDQGRWVDLDQLAELALPVAQRAIAEHLGLARSLSSGHTASFRIGTGTPAEPASTSPKETPQP